MGVGAAASGTLPNILMSGMTGEALRQDRSGAKHHVRSSPHFSQGQLICDGYWWIGAKATRTVAPKALAAIWFCVSPLGLVGEAADWVRRGVTLSR
jgi:hypothetical protein